MTKTKTKFPKTYKGKRTVRTKQQLYWRIVFITFMSAVVLLGFLGEHYTIAYETAAISTPERALAADLSVLEGTAMAEAIPFIRKASEYYDIPVELYLGIASAESSFNRFRCYNPWGIDTGRGNDPRCYNNWEHSVNGFSQLIRYYYLDEGLTTPATLVRKYVGYQNPDWVTNVSRYYAPQACR